MLLDFWDTQILNPKHTTKKKFRQISSSLLAWLLLITFWYLKIWMVLYKNILNTWKQERRFSVFHIFMLEYICSAIQEKTTNSATTKYHRKIRELSLRISFIYSFKFFGKVRQKLVQLGWRQTCPLYCIMHFSTLNEIIKKLKSCHIFNFFLKTQLLCKKKF